MMTLVGIFRVGCAAPFLVLAACSLIYDTSDLAVAPPADAGPDVIAKDASDEQSSASRYAATVLADGPLAYWRMGIASGNVVPDEAGHGNQLTIGGTVGYTLGVSGAIAGDSAISFDGAIAVANDSDALAFPGTAPFSVELWLRRAPTGGATDYQHVFNHSSGSGGNRRGFLLYYEPAVNAVEFEWAASSDSTTAAVTARPAGEWAHYVAVFDGQFSNLYVNGNAGTTESRSSSLPARSSSFVIGGEPDGNIYRLAGDLDEVAVYGRALTRQDVTRHFAAR
jgi:hypothetical protein